MSDRDLTVSALLARLAAVLAAADLDEIETAASTIKIEGARYPEEMLRRSGL